jgi:uncharacterized protein YjdB
MPIMRSPLKAFLVVSFLGLLNACGGSNHSASLQSIEVTPGAASAAAGSATQLTATGILSDGTHADITSEVTWTSGNTAIATVTASGLATGIAVGSTTLSASALGVTGSATYNVTAAVLASIEVTPPILRIAAGRTALMTATGVYSDNSTQNLSQVTWTSSNSAVASVSSGGVATAVGVGTATISASSGAVSGSTTLTVTGAVLTSLQVTPATPSVAKGLTQQFTATGIFSDNSKQDLTSQASWSSSSTAIATISESGGQATAAGVGSASISATIGGVSGNTTFTVTAALLTTIQVTPASPSMAKGLARQFIATGIFTDNSTLDLTFQVTWNSSNTAAATVSNAAASAGTVTAVAPGTATIAANLGSISGGTSVMVTPAALVSIQVTPPTLSIPIGVTQQFTATGIYTDSTTQNLTTSVTWSSNAGAVATISNAAGSQGLATPATVGSTTINAVSGAISGSTTLSVTPAALVSIQVTPAIPSVAKGLTQQFTATGVYTDNSTRDLTSQVTWASDNLAVATISNAAGSSGLASTPGMGTATISASLNVVGSTTLTVTPAQVVSIAVTPTTPSIAKGLTQQFVATGTYTDQSTQILTTTVLWASDTISVATISNAAGSQGLASTPATGTATISATYGTSGISSSTLLTVTPAVIDSIVISPTTPSVATGLTVNFTAMGIYTDTTPPADLTALVLWSSSNTGLVTLSNASPNYGLATTSPGVTGSAIIQATYNTGTSLLTASTTLTVTAAVLQSITVAPLTMSVPKGLTVQYTATGHYSDTTSKVLAASAVTWGSSTGDASVSNAFGSYGLATGLSIGSSMITATIGSIVSGPATLTVTAPILESIAVAQSPSSPTNPNIALGLTAQYAATGTYSDNSMGPLTGPVTWASSNNGVATIDGSGLATSVGYGTVTFTVTDTDSGVMGSATNTKVIASFQYGNSVFGILSTNCNTSSCHSATGSLGPPNTVSPSGDYWTLYDSTTSTTPASDTQAAILSGTFNSGISGGSPNLVVPGNPSGSTFYIANCLAIPGGSFIIRMPEGTSGLSAAQCTIINEWINEGANND